MAVWRRKLSNLRDLSKRCRWSGLARPELPGAPASGRPPCPDAMHHGHLCPAGQQLLLEREKVERRQEEAALGRDEHHRTA